ncbi:hypothetical protein L6R50_08930 [Myxococcota bacterium]|nr:hypothetical protein [Myxococcota bacterium]
MLVVVDVPDDLVAEWDEVMGLLRQLGLSHVMAESLPEYVKRLAGPGVSRTLAAFRQAAAGDLTLVVTSMQRGLRAFAVVRDRAAAGAALVGSGGET